MEFTFLGFLSNSIPMQYFLVNITEDDLVLVHIHKNGYLMYILEYQCQLLLQNCTEGSLCLSE